METDTASPSYESATELQAVHARLLERVEAALGPDASEAAEARALQALRGEIAEFLARGAATGVFLEPVRERTACQVLLDYWAQRLAAIGEPAPAARLARFDGERLPTLAGRPCPYVGLESFRSEAFFFGREEDTNQLVALIRATPLVVVLGASGSGKSSLVMGGALPVLAAEAGAWRMLPVWVPGDAVLVHFAQALASVLPGTDAQALAGTLRGDPAQLPQLLGTGAPVLVTIDQFEEVYTLAGADERQQLAQGLAALLDAGGGHRVVLTVREEFRSRIVELRALERWIDTAWYSMRPMGYEQLRTAVEGPAAIANLQFQPGVVDDLVKKVLGQPAALPLLQFTLRALWDVRDRNRITWEVYQAVGDPLTALKTSADAFFLSQAPQTQDEIRRLLLELVRVDEMLEAYRQPVRLQKLLAAGRANTEAVLQLLAQQDYVRIDAGGELVEVKHEALIRNWPRLVGWIDEKRIERRQRLALTQAARRWAESGRPSEGLLTGWQLQEAQRQQDSLTDLERDFVGTSAAAIERESLARELALADEARQARQLAAQERRLRTWATGLLGLSIIVAIALAWWGASVTLRLRIAEIAERDAQKAVEIVAARERASSALVVWLDQWSHELQTALDRVTAERDELFALQVKQAVAPGSHLKSSQPVEIYFHISEPGQRARAEQVAAQISGKGIKAYGAELVPVAPQRSQVRYFRAEDKPGGEEVQRLLKEYLGVDDIELLFVKGYAGKVPLRRYEVWFAPGSLPTTAVPNAPPSMRLAPTPR